MHRILFPQLAGRRWAPINLNEEALRDWPRNGQRRSPMLTPDACRRWVSELHRKMGIDYSFGGYLEDRSHIWWGSYLRQFVHLGVDFNVPPGTRVHAVRGGIVAESWLDPDKKGGWGGRIVVGQDDGWNMIYAHLGSDLPEEGSLVRPGQLLGKVASHTQNGGWYPHLHVQVFCGNAIPEDGYDSGPGNSYDPLVLYST